VALGEWRLVLNDVGFGGGLFCRSARVFETWRAHNRAGEHNAVRYEAKRGEGQTKGVRSFKKVAPTRHEVEVRFFA
jgi:hypothetical protein